MTMSPIVRARLLGSLVVALAFVAGVMTGLAVERRPTAGLSVTVTATATDRMPRELEQLDLTDAQEVRIRSILVRGRDRVLGVVHDFQPRMRAAMDSTDAEIDGVLTPPQRASLAEYRRAHPPLLDRKVIREKQ
jgi:Spy/CpxP family protein refolding chaperone